MEIVQIAAEQVLILSFNAICGLFMESFEDLNNYIQQIQFTFGELTFNSFNTQLEDYIDKFSAIQTHQYQQTIIEKIVINIAKEFIEQMSDYDSKRLFVYEDIQQREECLKDLIGYCLEQKDQYIVFYNKIINIMDYKDLDISILVRMCVIIDQAQELLQQQIFIRMCLNNYSSIFLQDDKLFGNEKLQSIIDDCNLQDAQIQFEDLLDRFQKQVQDFIFKVDLSLIGDKEEIKLITKKIQKNVKENKKVKQFISIFEKYKEQLQQLQLTFKYKESDILYQIGLVEVEEIEIQ